MTDDEDATHSTSQTVTVVSAAHVPPTASFTYSCTDLDCSFTDKSTYSDGTVVAWAWDFGDGNSASTQHPDHAFAAAGTYTVTLTVTDNNSSNDSENQTVSVVAPSLIPDAPTNLTASVQTTGKGKNKVVTAIQLNWSDNSNNEDKFVIERCEETGKGKNKACNFYVVATVDADTTGFSDSPSALSGTYIYRVKASNGEGDSAYTNTTKVRI